MKNKKADIPRYSLDRFRPVHRQDGPATPFGYNQIGKVKIIEGFELYSSDGLIGSMGPLKSAFYRISITVCGTLDMSIGLETYKHQPRTLSFTFPNQIFSKSNISRDAFGYYILFDPDFLNDILPAVKVVEEFPFYDTTGTPVFQVSDQELSSITDLIIRMDSELQQHRAGREKALKMYLYLLLLEAKRSYERQGLDVSPPTSDHRALVTRFRKLVSVHYLTKRKVSDYAQLLSVTPNYLNRVIKDTTGITASASIKEMLLQEARSLLRYTDQTISEIAYKLDFSDPASFNRFFRTLTAETPLTYRNRHH